MSCQEVELRVPGIPHSSWLIQCNTTGQLLQYHDAHGKQCLYTFHSHRGANLFCRASFNRLDSDPRIIEDTPELQKLHRLVMQWEEAQYLDS